MYVCMYVCMNTLRMQIHEGAASFNIYIYVVCKYTLMGEYVCMYVCKYCMYAHGGGG